MRSPTPRISVTTTVNGPIMKSQSAHQVPTIVLKNDCSGPTATWLRKPFLAQVCRRPRDRKLGTFDRCSQCRGSGSLIGVHDG